MIAAAILAVGVSVAVPPSAALAVTAVPPPINVVPSVLAGSSKAAVAGIPPIGSSMAYLALMMQQFAVKSTDAAAFAAKQAGTATAAQLSTVAAATKDFKVPAFKPTSLIKTVNAAGLALVAKDLGVMVGHASVEAIGFDVDGTVCAKGDLWAFAASVDCNEWKMTTEAIAEANADAVAGFTSDLLCSLDGLSCTQFSHFGEVTGSPDKSMSSAICVIPTGELRNIQWKFSRPGVEYSRTSPPGAPGDSSTCTGAGVGYGSKLSIFVNGVETFEEFVGFGYLAVGGGIEQFEPMVSSSGNPERAYRCEVRLSDGSSIDRHSETFTEGDGSTAPVLCPETVPDELQVVGTDIWLIGGQDPLLLWSQDTTPEYDAAATAYPECMGGECLVELWKGDKLCSNLGNECADWFDDPDKDLNYSCTIGSSAAPISECTVYAPRYKPGATATNAPYGHPETGEPIPNSAPGSSLNTPVADNANNECFPVGWGALNPVEWVMKPVQCALKWAFVPRTGVLEAQATRVQTAWSTTPPALIAEYVGEVADDVPVLDGCSGPRLNFTIDLSAATPFAPFSYDGYPLSACDPPMDWVADTARLLGGFAMYILAAQAITRHLGAVIGFGQFGGKS